MPIRLKLPLALFSFSLLAACGGGGGSGGGSEGGSGGGGGGDGGSGGGGAETATGVFKDTNVSGLSYASGDQSGTTDSLGRFTYEEGGSVTFRVGGVTLGTTDGAAVVTPLDLADGGQLSDTDTVNIARFLLMLDSDDDPSNGISISDAVLSAAKDWPQVNFASSTFDSDVSSIITDVNNADGTSQGLPSTNAAQSHVEGTLRCVTAGAFKGSFSGDDSGTFGFLVDAGDGSVSGIAYSETDDAMVSLLSRQAVSTDTARSFEASISGGGSFTGEFDTSNRVSGSWNDGAGASGTFSGSRIGGDADAQYRFTGQFTGGASGLMAFDVDTKGAVTGVAYSIDDDELSSITGTLSGNTLTATADGGTIMITGTLDTSGGSATGQWSTTDGSASGSFSGSGCELNSSESLISDDGGNATDPLYDEVEPNNTPAEADEVAQEKRVKLQAPFDGATATESDKYDYFTFVPPEDGVYRATLDRNEHTNLGSTDLWFSVDESVTSGDTSATEAGEVVAGSYFDPIYPELTGGETYHLYVEANPLDLGPTDTFPYTIEIEKHVELAPFSAEVWPLSSESEPNDSMDQATSLMGSLDNFTNTMFTQLTIEPLGEDWLRFSPNRTGQYEIVLILDESAPSLILLDMESASGDSPYGAAGASSANTPDSTGTIWLGKDLDYYIKIQNTGEQAVDYKVHFKYTEEDLAPMTY